MTNYHVLKIKFHGATNTSGSRIGITSERFDQRLIIPYNYEYNSSYAGAEAYLIANGFNIIGMGVGKDCMYIITDTFKPLK